MKLAIALFVIVGLGFATYKVIKREQPQPSTVANVPVPSAPNFSDLAAKGIITPGQATNGANVTAPLQISQTTAKLLGSGILKQIKTPALSLKGLW